MAGLYDNIRAKKARIDAGSGEKMNKVGSKKAPSDANFKAAAKTTKEAKAKKAAAKAKAQINSKNN